MTYSSLSNPLFNSIFGYVSHVCPQAFKPIILSDLNPKLNQKIDKTFDQGYISYHNNNLKNKNSATLIVDGTRIYDIFYNQDVDWVYGGDYINLISNVATFICRLRENNIEPIFYFEGSGTPSVPLRNKASKISTYVHEILEFIREKYESSDAFNFKRRLDCDVGRIIYPPHKMALIEIILRYECKVETRRNLRQEFMHEIVRDYRTLISNGENKILGILSANIELMFHIPSINLFYVHIYSEGQLLLTNLQCKRFIQSKLAQHLELRFHQLPLLLVFLHHNIHTKYPIHCPLVKTLFPALPQISLNTLLPGLSQFIRTHFDMQSPRRSYNGLHTLLFGSSKYPDQPANDVGFLQVHCRRYMITWSDELDPYKNIPYVNPFIFSLMKGYCIRNSVLLESSVHTGIPLTYATYRALLRGLIGVLLWLGPSSRINETAGYDGHTFYEYHLNEAETKYVLDPVTPLIPAALKGVAKPNNYDDIWTVESEDISILRWRLLLAIYSSNIPLDVIMKIEPIYVPLCLIIHYLISRHCYVAEHPLLKPLDAKALLLQAIIIRTLPQSTWNNEAFLNLKWPKVRTIGLATTFVYGVKMFYTAIALCGYPVQMSQTLIWHFFDGKLFHAISQQLDEGIQVETICLGNGAIIQKLADLENIVYNRE